MRLTLEPISPSDNHNKIIIETKSDNLNIWDVWDELIRPALIGWSFLPETVDSLRGEE